VCRRITAWWRNNSTKVHNRGCCHCSRCHHYGAIVAAGRERGFRKDKAFAHSANVVFKLLELLEIVSWWWQQSNRKVSCLLFNNGGTGGGVMVILDVAFGFCYGCATVAVSTRWLIFEKEIVVEKIAFIFGTGVAGGN